MKKLLIGLGCAVLIFSLCSKTTEEKADAFLKKGDKSNAYRFYQKAMLDSKDAPSQELKEKYLSMTLDRAKERLIDDESLESINLFNNDIVKYVDANTSKQLKQKYADFLCEWSDSVYVKFEDINGAISLLQKAHKYNTDDVKITQKEDAIRNKYGNIALTRSKELLAAGEKSKEPLQMIEAEYWALGAEKYLPANKEAEGVLQKTRKVNLSTYSAYNRAIDNGRTDPEIDKYNCYFAITGQKGNKKDITVEGTFYNLSPAPVNLSADQFALVDRNGTSHPALKQSTFEKMTVDVKGESKLTLKFSGDNMEISKVTFTGLPNQTAAKFWP